MHKKENPLVSVCMITYGHEKYLENAIHSILNQEVDFEYELIIANDNSPDNTDEIVKEIILQHSEGNRINYIKHSKNIGAIPNFHFSFTKAKGKYIAICEGDDYWIDNRKLQQQITFLETNQDYSASFHDVYMLFNDKKVSFSKHKKNIINETVYFDDVVSSDWLIPTCSFVFRKDKMKLPPFYEKLNYGDYPLFCCIVINSKAHYTNEIMGVYRRNNSSSLTNTIRTFGYLSVSADYIELLNWLNNFANEEDRKSIEKRINHEIKQIRNQVEVYKNSKIINFYNKYRKYLFI